MFFGRDLLHDPPDTFHALLNHNRDIGLFARDRMVVLGLQKTVEFYAGDPHVVNLELEPQPSAGRFGTGEGRRGDFSGGRRTLHEPPLSSRSVGQARRLSYRIIPASRGPLEGDHGQFPRKPRASPDVS